MTTSYKQDGQLIKHHMAFSESYELNVKNYAISIGYVSYEPSKYYSIEGTTITVDSSGKCTAFAPKTFVPELAWIVDKILPGDIAADYMQHNHLVGPSGLLAVFMFMMSRKKAEVSDMNNVYNYKFLTSELIILNNQLTK